MVSTHSRLKAAGKRLLAAAASFLCFNTQPPEGGWTRYRLSPDTIYPFQHTAA